MTTPEALLLHEITETPGFPVLLARAAWVMRAKGSQITDAQFQAQFFGKSRKAQA
eukprot:COSAG05_NODE_8326_length_714_cov_1.269919_2_plen_54_part_01